MVGRLFARYFVNLIDKVGNTAERVGFRMSRDFTECLPVQVAAETAA